jgi:hypothetical protein
MRNLHVARDRKEELALPTELGDAVKFAVDSDAGLLFIAGSGLCVAAYKASGSQVCVHCDVWTFMAPCRVPECESRNAAPAAAAGVTALHCHEHPTTVSAL